MTNESSLESVVANGPLLESLYEIFLHSPEKLDENWRVLFGSLDSGRANRMVSAGSPLADLLRIHQLIENFRTYGHLASLVDPVALSEKDLPEELSLQALGFMEDELNKPFPTCGLLKSENASLKEILNAVRTLYSGRIGFEFKGFVSKEVEKWLQQKIETTFAEPLFTADRKRRIFLQLMQSELFEGFLHTKFPGQKRFSLEGAETLIPMLAELLDDLAGNGSDEFILGMAHRGRLNVLAHILQKGYEAILREFDEGYFPDSFEGTGDVKYHKGFLSEALTVHGKKVSLTLTPNPSHLESVDAVLEGIVKGKQIKNGDATHERVIPILVHGDAALSGQGVVYETMQLGKLPAYETGGTFHFVVNNQIGFTTSPQEGRSTRYCTDVAKTFGAPIFHVNAEDPEAAVFATLLASELRMRFKIDVFIEMNCYRKYGHNESDEPLFTQPLLYKKIRQKKSIKEIYKESLFAEKVLDPSEEAKNEEAFKASLIKALKDASVDKKREESSSEALPPPLSAVQTQMSENQLRSLAEKFCKIPEDFKAHPKLENLFKDRLKMVQDPDHSLKIDWGMAEFLSLASLIDAGVPVRLSGQDSGRGTFSHRHGLWVDQESGVNYYPLQHLKENQVRADLINTPLSEYAALGFEYGYSLGYPETFVLWEAQFGDFVNGAQIVIDQYIAAAEQKWGQKSDLTLLLPHGYEGQGPEHSSARLERFLSLAGHDNMTIVYPSTPGQFFHLLRAQGLSESKKPLIVMTPKALLRLPECISSLADLAQGRFHEVISDATNQRIQTLCFCTGKVYFDLKKFQESEKLTNLLLVRIEQLYPFPEKQLRELLSKHDSVKNYLFTQEEPENMGAWGSLRPSLLALLPKNSELKYNGREASASPAAGSYVLHKKEHAAIMNFIKQQCS